VSLFTALTKVPDTILAGQQETWAEDLEDYPIASYSVAYVFSALTTPVDGPQRFTVTGVETGTETYTFTFPADTKPGRYVWEKRITQASPAMTRVADTGCLVIQPNLANAQTESYAQAQVAAIQTALTTLSTSTNISVSFNGQSFTKGDTSKLQGHLAYWESVVNREQRELLALNGTNCAPSGRIRTRLSRYGGGYYADNCGC
jgi:hypothetical protein